MTDGKEKPLFDEITKMMHSVGASIPFSFASSIFKKSTPNTNEEINHTSQELIDSYLEQILSNKKVVKTLNAMGFYKISDLKNIDIQDLLKTPLLSINAIDDILNIVFDNNVQCRYLKLNCNCLSKIKLSTALKKALYGLNILYEEDLNDIDLNLFSTKENTPIAIVEELIDFLLLKNIPFLQKQFEGILIKDLNITPATKSVLYRSNIFFKENLNNVDLNNLFSLPNCGPSVINELIKFIKENNINCVQLQDTVRPLSESNLSYETLAILYKNQYYFWEDLNNLSVSTLKDLNGLYPKIIDNILDFLIDNDYKNFDIFKDKKRIRDLGYLPPVISALYKAGVYFDSDNIVLEDVIAANSNISNKTIDDIKKIQAKTLVIAEKETIHSKRIPWDELQVALLIDTYLKIENNIISRKEGVTNLSTLLRNQALKIGLEIDDYYRNENGIGMRLEEIRYCYTNGTRGLKNCSNLEKTMTELQIQNPEMFNQILNNAQEKYNISNVEINKNIKHNTVEIDEINSTIEDYQIQENICEKIYIEDCPFSLRVRNSLLRANITKLSELILTKESELLKLKNFGKGSMDEIKEFIEKCKNDSQFWSSILKRNNLPTTYKFNNSFEDINKNKALETADNYCSTNEELCQENTKKDLPDIYFASIKSIEGLSEKALEILFQKGIRKIGQLVQYSPEYLLRDYDNLLDEISILFEDEESKNTAQDLYDNKYYNDIKSINKFFDNNGIYIYPIELSFEDKARLEKYTKDEIEDLGLSNIIISILNEYLHLLSQKEQDIMVMRYGLAPEGVKTLEEIGTSFGVTRERIRQIESKAFKKFVKVIHSSDSINTINSLISTIHNEYGDIYKIKDSKSIVKYLKLLDKFSKEFNFTLDENFLYVVKDKDWYSSVKNNMYEILEVNNKIVLSLVDFKEYLDQVLSRFVHNNTDYQKLNYQLIYEDLLNEFLQNYLIKLDDSNYKIIKETKRGKAGKVKTGNRNEEIVSLFATIYPEGVHLPIDKVNKLEENLKDLVEKIPYKMSIRTLSDGIIKNAKEIILWDTGVYRHINTIHIQWSAVDTAIENILSEFENDNSIFSIKKIYENNINLFTNAGIPNATALLGLVKYKENPRIGNSKLELFDVYANGENINKNALIEEYLLKSGDWVSISDMQTHFCDELGWEVYQIEQYVSKNKNAKKDVNLGYIHIDNLRSKLNKDSLRKLLEQLYRQISYTNEPVRLESLRSSSFRKIWCSILGDNVTASVMTDFIDSLQLKLPMIFYQSTAYGLNYVSKDIIAKFNKENIFENYLNKNLNNIYDDFKSLPQENLINVIDSKIKVANVLLDKNLQEICDFCYENNIQELGMLLFFPFNCIEIKKMFTDYQIKKTIEKIYSWVESFKEDTQETNENIDITSIFWR